MATAAPARAYPGLGPLWPLLALVAWQWPWHYLSLELSSSVTTDLSLPVVRPERHWAATGALAAAAAAAPASDPDRLAYSVTDPCSGVAFNVPVTFLRFAGPFPKLP